MAARQVTHNGITYNSLKEFCNAHKMSVSKYQARIRRGMTVDEALSPIDRKSQNIEFDGVVYQSKAKLAEAHDIEPATFYNRLRSGMSTRDALRNTHYNQKVV